MGLIFNEDRKHYCGRYRGVDIWQYGCMIGNNWYGVFYATEKRGKSQRRMKVKDSERNTFEEVKQYIDKHYGKD